MKFFIMSCFLVLAFQGQALAMSITAKPFEAIILVEKTDYPVNVSAHGGLTCGGTKCFFGHCTYHGKDKDLVLEVVLDSEDESHSKYKVIYKKTETLKNPYAHYRESFCSSNIVLQVEDPRYENMYAPMTKFVHGWSKFYTNKFSNFKELNGMVFKHYYSWFENDGRMSCSFSDPNLCRQFLYLAPLKAPSLLQAEVIGGGTKPIFPKPTELE